MVDAIDAAARMTAGDGGLRGPARRQVVVAAAVVVEAVRRRRVRLDAGGTGGATVVASISRCSCCCGSGGLARRSSSLRAELRLLRREPRACGFLEAPLLGHLARTRTVTCDLTDAERAARPAGGAILVRSRGECRERRAASLSD